MRGAKRVKVVVLDDRSSVAGDLVVVGVGVVPESSLPRQRDSTLTTGSPPTSTWLQVQPASLLPGTSIVHGIRFSGALLGMYARIPAMRKEGSVWPSSQGTAVSKDSWMFAIGFGLVADALTRSHRHDEERC